MRGVRVGALQGQNITHRAGSSVPMGQVVTNRDSCRVIQKQFLDLEVCITKPLFT